MDNNDKLFPAEFVSLTAEYHFQKYNAQTTIIYRMVLGCVMLAILAMFFIKVDISVKSTGAIKSPTEHNEIKTLVSGRVDSLFIKENQHVKQGQVLVILKSEAITQQDVLARTQQTDYQSQLNDLEKLAAIARNQNWGSKPQLISSLYSQQYVLLMQKARDAAATLETVRRNYERYNYLYKNHAISSAEFDQVQLTYKNAQSALQVIYDTQGSQWQAELNNLKMQIRNLQSQGEAFKQEKDFYTLRAPVSGTVQNLKGIQPGTVIAANEIIAEISPETGLIAEVYALPKDIGLIKAGTKANFQVDAFNYNQWGMLSGKVISVSNDIFTNAQGQPFFKVRCKLNDDKLRLKNGYVGLVKKGMTIQANFFVTRRTIFQLLYDKTDDWLNPNQMSQTSASQ